MRTVNMRNGGSLGRNVVRIDRRTKWGNPFIIGADGTREQVIAQYRSWVLTQPSLLNDLPELIGKDLACWCAPLPCHGDVLLELIEYLHGKTS